MARSSFARAGKARKFRLLPRIAATRARQGPALVADATGRRNSAIILDSLSSRPTMDVIAEADTRRKADALFRHLRPPGPVLHRTAKDHLIAAGVCVGLVAVALGAGLLLERFLHVPNVLLVFLPVVLLVAARYGFWAAALTSVLGIAATSYLTNPMYSFAVSDSGRVWALLIFVVVAAFTSSLAAQLRQRAAAVSRHSRVIEQLLSFSSKLASLSTVDELAREAAKQIASMLSADIVLLVPEHGVLRVMASSESGAALDARELLAANWSFENTQPAGRGTEIFPGAARLYLPLDTGRRAIGVIGIYYDRPAPVLTPEEAKLVDALRDQLAVSIDRAVLAEEILETQMLAETEKLRTALLTSISHDLRTPLASILGNVSSLREYGHLYDEPTRREMLGFAEDETLRLSRFVENLLQMTRIDSGALEPTIESVDLADLIGAALKRTENATAQHRVRTDLPADLPMVPVDFVLAEHVLVNVLENAAKYSPGGSTITVAVAEQADWLKITVMDEGPGIPEEDLPRIFDRFFRAGATDRRRAGVGLGLAICKGFVEAMGGHITAHNRTDRSGAVLTVSLPKAQPEEELG